MKIGFNKPHLTGKEITYVQDAFERGKFSGNGHYTQMCQSFFEGRYGFKKCFLTSSCTDALEMAALLMDIGPGDEIILPSFTFTSTANAFLLRGATLRFVDSLNNHPNIDPIEIEKNINPKTKGVVIVHYAGMACDMDKIMSLVTKHGLYLVEDAAQAIDSFYNEKPLGSFGHFAAFSFHETKNISAGEGGLLAVNDERFNERAEVIWEKGTNRAAFWRGEVDKYNWVDIGSSFLPSEITAAFLFAQLVEIENIQKKRIEIWNRYHQQLTLLEKSHYVTLPEFQKGGIYNGHMYYLICKSQEDRTALIAHLKKNEVYAAFHYLSLHSSPYFENEHDRRILANADRFSDCLVRLPLYFDLKDDEQMYIIENVKAFFRHA